MPPASELSYVLPLRWRDSAGLEELACYLEELSPLVAEVLVVDGSERELFERHGRRLARLSGTWRPIQFTASRWGRWTASPPG